jgi:ornithine cyclodeaminase/alanine dehydrogenase-like protein (mu-crystallin family)
VSATLATRMQFIDAATTTRHLAFGPLIAALRAMFAAGCESPPRQVLTIAASTAAGGDAPGVTLGDTPAGTVLVMPAWVPGARIGLKTIGIFPGNAALGLPALHATYQLFDASTGVPLALLDGDVITARRTAATSALAASMLARGDASWLVVVGAGRVAALLPAAFAAVRPIRTVQVWNHRPRAAVALAEVLRAEGHDASATEDLQEAVRAADIVSCATLSTVPLVRGAWLGDGAHLDLVGSFTPQMREADAACFARCRVWIDSDEALAKSGDLLQAIGEGGFVAEGVAGTLAGLCRGTDAGRRSAAGRTLFKAVGSALADLAAAELVWSGLRVQPSATTAPPGTERR